MTAPILARRRSVLHRTRGVRGGWNNKEKEIGNGGIGGDPPPPHHPYIRIGRVQINGGGDLLFVCVCCETPAQKRQQPEFVVVVSSFIILTWPVQSVANGNDAGSTPKEPRLFFLSRFHYWEPGIIQQQTNLVHVTLVHSTSPSVPVFDRVVKRIQD